MFELKLCVVEPNDLTYRADSAIALFVVERCVGTIVDQEPPGRAISTGILASSRGVAADPTH